MRRRRRHSLGTRGSASLQLVVLFPALMGLILAGMQAALWFHARNTALAAAQVGVRAARTYHAQPNAAAKAAAHFAHRAGDGLLRSVTVDAGASTATTVVLVVRGRVPSLVPGLKVAVRQVDRGPRERVVPVRGAP